MFNTNDHCALAPRNFFEKLPDGVHPMAREHVPQVVELLSSELLRLNPVWKVGGVTLGQLRTHLLADLNSVLDCQDRTSAFLGRAVTLNYVFTFQGELMFAMLNYDIYQHHRLMNNKPPTLPILITLLEAAQPIEKAAGYSRLLERGEGKVLYGAWGVGNPSSVKDSFRRHYMMNSAVLWIYKKIQQQGYQRMIGRGTSDRASRMWQALGGGVVAVNEFQFEQRQHTLYMTVIDFRSESFQRELARAGQFQKEMLGQVRPKL